MSRLEFGEKVKKAAITRAAGNGKPRSFLRAAISLTSDDCLLWPFTTNSSGYGQIWWYGKVSYVHRVVCQETHGEPGHNKDAAHSCGIKLCCNPNHLRWATRSENHRDKIDHGTHLRGSSQNGAKLNEQDVRNIRRLKGNMLQKEIAAKYGVSRQAVGGIHRGESWGWLDA